MKQVIRVKREIEAKYLGITVPVRYGEEDIPSDFFGRKGDVWSVEIDIDTRRIQGWPFGETADFSMKVCDSGTYTLRDANGCTVKVLEHEYVPHSLITGRYGDYIEMVIDEFGQIKNWPAHPSLLDFFREVD